MGGLGSGGHAQTGRRPQEAPILDDTPLPDVPMPDGLSMAEAAVWQALAPLAIGERTLTPVTSERFRLLCEARVMVQSMAAQLQADGWTYKKVTIDGSGQEHTEVKAHPLCSPHRGMMQRVEAGMAAFRLAPIGKALAVKQKDRPKSALEQLQAARPSIRAIG